MQSDFAVFRRCESFTIRICQASVGCFAGSALDASTDFQGCGRSGGGAADGGALVFEPSSVEKVVEPLRGGTFRVDWGEDSEGKTSQAGATSPAAVEQGNAGEYL